MLKSRIENLQSGSIQKYVKNGCVLISEKELEIWNLIIPVIIFLNIIIGEQILFKND